MLPLDALTFVERKILPCGDGAPRQQAVSRISA
jgi:hypothetical protein